MKKFVSKIDSVDNYEKARKIAGKVYRFITPYANKGTLHKAPDREFDKIVTIRTPYSDGNSDVYFVINGKRFLLQSKSQLTNEILKALEEQNS